MAVIFDVTCTVVMDAMAMFILVVVVVGVVVWVVSVVIIVANVVP